MPAPTTKQQKLRPLVLPRLPGCEPATHPAGGMPPMETGCRPSERRRPGTAAAAGTATTRWRLGLAHPCQRRPGRPGRLQDRCWTRLPVQRTVSVTRRRNGQPAGAGRTQQCGKALLCLGSCAPCRPRGGVSPQVRCCRPWNERVSACVWRVRDVGGAAQAPLFARQTHGGPVSTTLRCRDAPGPSTSPPQAQAPPSLSGQSESGGRQVSGQRAGWWLTGQCGCRS